MSTSLDDTSHALFVCEGTFEEVAIRVLRDAESLAKAAREYKRLQNLDKGEICLADLLATSFS